jgi:WD40 repeat protein
MSAQIVDDYVVQEHEFDDDDGEEDDFEDDDEALEHAAEMLRPDKATSSGYLLASGSCDELVKLWDAGTGALKTTLQGHTDDVMSVAFSP